MTNSSSSSSGCVWWGLYTRKCETLVCAGQQFCFLSRYLFFSFFLKMRCCTIHVAGRCCRQRGRSKQLCCVFSLSLFSPPLTNQRNLSTHFSPLVENPKAIRARLVCTTCRVINGRLTYTHQEFIKSKGPPKCIVSLGNNHRLGRIQQTTFLFLL